MHSYLNKQIEIYKKHGLDSNLLSDGYHTFGDLYNHRIELYMALCRVIADQNPESIWKSKKNSEGEPWPGWFILGINTEPGYIITYHIPIDRWDDASFEEIERSHYDGHTSEDVITRLKTL